jgi:hypothetical protein
MIGKIGETDMTESPKSEEPSVRTISAETVSQGAASAAVATLVPAGPSAKNEEVHARSGGPRTSEGKDQSIKPGAVATGPRTLAGKRRASQNARKHGIFAGELNFRSPAERRQFDRLRSGLVNEFRPVSESAWLILDDTADAAWRIKQAKRFEQGALATHLESVRAEKQNQSVDVESSMKFPFRTTAYELQRRLKSLSDLRERVEKDHYVPAEWEKPITQAFGVDFWKTLVDFLPMDLMIAHAGVHLAVRRAEHYVAEFQGHTFPPPSPTLEQIEQYGRVEHLARGDWALKAIDLKRQDLELLLSNAGPLSQEADASHDRLTLALRYQAAARRDFYRGLEELRRLSKGRTGDQTSD